MNGRFIAIAICVLLAATSSACRRKDEAKTDTIAPLEPPKQTLLLDVDQHDKPVLTIEGWQDYHKGDVVSAQHEGAGRDYEIIGGWFIVEPTKDRKDLWRSHFIKMYHVKVR
jgi:hypothetical protein